MDIPAYGERNLAKDLEDNDKQFSVEPCRVGEREKVLKKWIEQVKTELKKKKKKLIHEFRLIEIDRRFSKFLKQFQNNFD